MIAPSDEHHVYKGHVWLFLFHRLKSEVLRRSVESAKYSTSAFGDRCREMGVQLSLGSVGDAYDDAITESFFASLEYELIDRRCFKTKTEARLAVFSWIECWYNLRRSHSALDELSPSQFEEAYLKSIRTVHSPVEPKPFH